MSTTQKIDNDSIAISGDCAGDQRWEVRELTIGDCDHLSLNASSDFQNWLNRTMGYIAARSGPSPKLRMYTYEHGVQTIVALDIFANEPSSNMAITILISPGSATLTCPLDDQLDISLPSFPCVIDFAARLANCNQTQSPPFPHHLEILPWVGPLEARRALMS